MKSFDDPILSLLLGRARSAVLSLLLPSPEQALHVREIARTTGTSAGSLHRELRMLAQAGLLVREQVGRQVFYRAATGHPLYGALVALVGGGAGEVASPRGTSRKADRASGPALRFSSQRLAAVCRRHHVRRLAMFGSAARGELTKGSDIDLIAEFEEGCAPSFWESPSVEQDLSAVFGGRRVDLLPPEVLANPFRRASILKDLRVLYEQSAR